MVKKDRQHPPFVVGADEIKKIVLFQALYLGDFLCLVPALRALRQLFPSSRVDFLGSPWLAEIIGRYEYVDRFFEFPGFPGLMELPVDPSRTEAFLRRARSERYDLALQLHGDGRISNEFVLRLGARYTAGYHPTHSPDLRLSLALPFPNHQHEVLRPLSLVGALGGAKLDSFLEFPLAPRDLRRPGQLLAAEGVSDSIVVVGLHPGARAPARRWPEERFAQLGDLISAAYGAAIVLTGSAPEQGLTGRVRAAMSAPTIDLAGKTSIGDLGGLLSRMALLITNDSGPSHLASALGTRSIALFGPTDPTRWAPLDEGRHQVIHKGVECSPCSYTECPIDHRCLESVSVAEVWDAARKALNLQLPILKAADLDHAGDLW